MNEIIIGEISESYSTVKYYDYPDVSEFISYNNQLYWCTELLTDTTILISRDTEKGLELTGYLEKKETVECIKDYLLKIVLTEMDISDFKALLIKSKNEAFQRGIRFNQAVMRETLGIQ